ncbi:hypothetical protein GIJ78_06015 [Escherichia coli]|nr:hypothetical protein [Pseudomonas sp. Marseille-Q3773]MRF40082.1 hypothetical protein [Escherichia coli]
MPEKIELDLDTIEAAAKAATPQDFDSAQVADTEEGWIECPCCGGEGSVELTADYLNYDGQALGVQFYGVGDPHVHAEAYYRAARPAVMLALIAEVRALRADAERYRWLRDPDGQEDLGSEYNMPPIICGYAEHEDILANDALDRAIDLGIEATKP